jgi:hypothetical protein
MQLRPVVEARRAAHALFVGEALGLHQASQLPVGQLAAHSTAFRRMWSPVRWENKEAWWRLTVDGIPLLGIPTCAEYVQRAVGVGHNWQGSRGDPLPECTTFGHTR